MKGYITNIEKDTGENENFRKVLYTAKNSQLVLMALKPGEEIGEEIHTLDQFIRVEEGKGKAILEALSMKLKTARQWSFPPGRGTTSSTLQVIKI